MGRDHASDEQIEDGENVVVRDTVAMAFALYGAARTSAAKIDPEVPCMRHWRRYAPRRFEDPASAPPKAQRALQIGKHAHLTFIAKVSSLFGDDPCVI